MVLGIKSGLRRLSVSPRRRSGRSSLSSSSSDQRDTKSNVKVVVRVRPQNAREAETESIIRVLDSNVLVFDPKAENNDFFFHGKKQKGRDLLKKPKKDLKFAFDCIFDVDATNEEVFKDTTHSIVDGLLDGYNCSVFAYGATGAGKTFTMLGNQETPGITFLTVMELYRRIECIKSDKMCDIAVSYLEVYNESIHDLLMPSKSLALREDPQRGVVVSGLTLHKPKNAHDLLSMLQYGNKNRTQHPTDANSESSRSHAVFVVYVKQQDRSAGLQANVRVAKMVLIDLAGSERATVTRNSGARMREGANINKSLLALGNCINSLADKKTKSQHVPYRDSKLTRLLKDSLGGNCQTVMIAAVSPSSLSYEDTYNTLQYANRAKRIKANLKKNVMSVDMHITKYAKIVEELKKRIAELEEQLRHQPNVPSAIPYCSCSGRVDNNCEPEPVSTMQAMNLQNEMTKIFADRQSVVNELLNLEIMDRHLGVRLSWRQTVIGRLTMLSVHNLQVERSTQKADHAIKLMERKRTRITVKIPEVVSRLAENSKLVDKITRAVESSDEAAPKNKLKRLQLEDGLAMERKQVHHLQQVVKMQDAEMARSEIVLEKALKLVRQQQLILSGHGYLTSDLKEDFEEIYKQVEKSKEVVWADQDKKTERAYPVDVNKLIRLTSSSFSEDRGKLSAVNENDSEFDPVPKSLSKNHCVSPPPEQTISHPSDEKHKSLTCDEQNCKSKTVAGDKPTVPVESPGVSVVAKKVIDRTIKLSRVEAVGSSSKSHSIDEESDEVFMGDGCKSAKDETRKKKAVKRSLCVDSSVLPSVSEDVISGVKKLGLESAHKVKLAKSVQQTMAVSADILFEPPIINKNAKKCLNNQFSNLNSAHNRNETCESSSQLNETFEVLACDATIESSNSSDGPPTKSKVSRLNITFTNDETITPSATVASHTRFNFKTPSRTPLSASSQNSAKSSLNLLNRSTEFKAKKSGMKLSRTHSISSLKSENLPEGRKMKRFYSSRSIPAAMTKTALLRNILSKGNAVSSSKSDTMKKMVNEMNSKNSSMTNR